MHVPSALQDMTFALIAQTARERIQSALGERSRYALPTGTRVHQARNMTSYGIYQGASIAK